MAVKITGPRATAVTNPWVDTVATSGLLEIHSVPFTGDEAFEIEPLANVTMAANCTVSPFVLKVVFGLVIAMEIGIGEICPYLMGPTEDGPVGFSWKKSDCPTVVM